MPRTTIFRSMMAIVIIALATVLVACGDTSESDPASTSPADSNGSAASPSENGSSSSKLDRPIMFADFAWDSALVHNRIAQFILENGYGYETDVTFGETIPLVQGMIRGDIDAATEIWVDQVPAYIDAVEDGTLLDLGTNYGESIQGWFVPTYVIEGDPERGIEPMAPDLKTIDDLPKYKELFADPEDPSKGRYYDCIAGWECERINEAKFKAYGLDEHYNRFLPGSGAALATSLVSAYEKGEPWFGYYWGPTWIFAQLDLTQIEEPPYTEECWENILDGDEACAYPAVKVRVSVTADFAEQAPDVVEFLSNYETTFDQTSAMLLYLQEEGGEAEDAAVWFLKEYEDVWTQWVPDDVAEKVKAALETA